MGGDKAATVLAGQPLIRWVMAAMGAQVDHLVISGNAPDLARYGAPLLADDPSTTGPASGLLAAIAQAQALNAMSLLTAPCDIPFLPSDAVQVLSGPGVGVPRVAGRPVWAVSCWSRQALQAFTPPEHAAAGTGTGTGKGKGKGLSLRSLLDPQDLQLIDVAPTQDYFGVNTPQALRQAEEIAAHRAYGDAAL